MLYFMGKRRDYMDAILDLVRLAWLRGAVWISGNAKGTCNGLLVAQTTKLTPLHSQANNLFYIRGTSYSRIRRAKFDYKPPLFSGIPFSRFLIPFPSFYEIR